MRSLFLYFCPEGPWLPPSMLKWPESRSVGMRKPTIIAFFFLLFLGVSARPAKAQVPSYDCSKLVQIYTDVTTGNIYSCKISGGVGTWQLISVGGLSFVASLPATCTPGVTASVQLSVAPYTINYCSATNTWTAAGASSINAATQYAVPYYSASGSATILSGFAAPTTPNGVSFIATSTPSGGVAAAPAFSWPGGNVNAQTGATHPIAATDRAGVITASNAGAQTYTVPDGGTTNFANSFDTAVKNLLGGTVTLTQTSTSTFNCGVTLAATSCKIFPGSIGFVYLNPSNNWEVAPVPMFDGAGSLQVQAGSFVTPLGNGGN